MGLVVDSRTKPPDVGITVFHIECEVKAIAHIAPHMSNVMLGHAI